MQKTLFSILLSTIWISLCEFGRNELAFNQYWVEHYKNMGLEFPAEPINGAVWGIWALCFSILLFIISRRFSLIETIGIGWSAGFVLMWLVVGNMGVLPFEILLFAIPWSLLEVGLAVWIMKKLSPNAQQHSRKSN